MTVTYDAINQTYCSENPPSVNPVIAQTNNAVVRFQSGPDSRVAAGFNMTYRILLCEYQSLWRSTRVWWSVYSPTSVLMGTLFENFSEVNESIQAKIGGHVPQAFVFHCCTLYTNVTIKITLNYKSEFFW